MDIFRIVMTGLVLTTLLAFRFKPKQSRFEINRLAEHGAKPKILARFLDIYPGLIILVRVLALITAIILTMSAADFWGWFNGGLVALVVILLAILVARLLGNAAQNLIQKHLEFFNKYLAWTGPLGRIIATGDEPLIGSEHELLHLVEQGDFLDDQTKILLKNALAFHNQTVEKVMTPRDQIAFIHARDALTPKLLDELFVSEHKIFPVVQGSLDRVVGLLYLDDVLPIEQTEKVLPEVMRKCPPPIDHSAPLESALNQMSEYYSTILLVAKDDKIIGLVTAKDIVRQLFSIAE